MAMPTALSSATPMGSVVNGDAVLLAAARDMQSRGVSTGTIRGGDHHVEHGTGDCSAQIGHSHVARECGRQVCSGRNDQDRRILGGEQSGHIIFRDGEATTGDGLLTALRVMEVVARTRTSLKDLVSDLKVFPQTIQNVRVREKIPFSQVPAIQSAIQAAEKELDGNGRL